MLLALRSDLHANLEALDAFFDPQRESVTFHRVPNDHLAAARKRRAAGLSDVWSGP